MDDATARRFAEAWRDSWNSHDLDRVLEHFADDVVFSSPLVPALTGGDNPLRGRDALRAYWAEGLRRLPELHFKVDDVFLGTDGVGADGDEVAAVGIAYRNERGRRVVEVLTVGADGLVHRGWALYAPEA